jgi:hypothetical protein
VADLTQRELKQCHSFARWLAGSPGLRRFKRQPTYLIASGINGAKICYSRAELTAARRARSLHLSALNCGWDLCALVFSLLMAAKLHAAMFAAG